MGVSFVGPDELELAEVGDFPAAGGEALQGPAVLAVVQYRLVPLHEALVAGLALTDVVPQAGLIPPVVVAVTVARGGIGEEHHHRRLPRR